VSGAIDRHPRFHDQAVTALHEVREAPLERFDGVLSADGIARLHSAVKRAHPLLEGRTIRNVNSTARGGGVAEMLAALVPYARSAGVDVRWAVGLP
jgi:trehalose synthase